MLPLGKNTCTGTFECSLASLAGVEAAVLDVRL